MVMQVALELGRGTRGQRLEEASFVVVESGKLRFFVRPRFDVEAPSSLDDVQRFSFTLAPRNRGTVRRIAIGEKRMPDARARERLWATVDRVGSALEPRRVATRTRGARREPGLIEVARGTYAIATHRDHAHLLYELETAMTSDAASVALLRQLRIMPRASYIAAIFHPEAAWRVGDAAQPEPLSSSSVDDALPDKIVERRFTPLDPALLELEGAELVLTGGGQSAEVEADEHDDDAGGGARS